MEILPIITPLLHASDDLAGILLKTNLIKAGDIIVVSSKVLAMTEGRILKLADATPSDEAMRLSKTCHQDPRFTQLILDETQRMNGEVAGESPFAILTSLRPNGMKSGRILCPNAGLDLSNVDEGSAIGWPLDPVKSAINLKNKLGDVAVIVSDSCCNAGRLGVTAFALACASIDPFRSEVGTKDLFGKALRVTHEAIADQLATAGNAVMGNAAQSCPAAVLRDHHLPFSPFTGWVDGMDEENDLFRNFFRK
jgi:coenzyme F420-0:L-glutamate ligase